MNKIGIYGGTFDPVHFGHLITAQSVFEKRNLDKLIFIPCNISPLKRDKNSISAKDRLEMLRLAIGDNPSFEIDDYEIKKGDISYTLDTLHYLKQKFDNLELIIGYDNLVVFEEWYKPDEIVELAQLVVMKRVVDEEVNIKNKYFESAIILDTPTIEISSTDIRKRVYAGKQIDFMVPENVSKYILENGIYK